MAGIEEWYIKKFTEDVLQDPQASGKLWDGINYRKETNPGQAVAFRGLGSTKMQKVTASHQDSPHMEMNHGLRWAYPVAYDWGTLVDNYDTARAGKDPLGDYREAAAMALGRTKDAVILDACTGAAMSGTNGSTSNAFPAGNVIAADNQGFTFDKLNRLTKALRANYAFDRDDIYFIHDAHALMQLISDVYASHKDYVQTVEALRDGRLPGNRFMNMTWICIEPRKGAPTAGAASGDNDWGIPYNATTDVTSCIAFSASRIGLAVVNEGEFDFDPKRSDKKFNPYLYLKFDAGAVRREDASVYKLDIDNSPTV